MLDIVEGSLKGTNEVDGGGGSIRAKESWGLGFNFTDILILLNRLLLLSIYVIHEPGHKYYRIWGKNPLNFDLSRLLLLYIPKFIVPKISKVRIILCGIDFRYDFDYKVRFWALISNIILVWFWALVSALIAWFHIWLWALISFTKKGAWSASRVGFNQDLPFSFPFTQFQEKWEKMNWMYQMMMNWVYWEHHRGFGRPVDSSSNSQKMVVLYGNLWFIC